MEIRKGFVEAGVLGSTREEVDVVGEREGCFLIRKEGFNGHSGDGNCWWLDEEDVTISTKKFKVGDSVKLKHDLTIEEYLDNVSEFNPDMLLSLPSFKKDTHIIDNYGELEGVIIVHVGGNWYPQDFFVLSEPKRTKVTLELTEEELKQVKELLK